MEFTKPKSLNGFQLKEEFKVLGIIVEVIDDNSDGTISIEIPKEKEDLAFQVVSEHVGIDKEPTVSEKLASVGLSLEDLKTALAQ